MWRRIAFLLCNLVAFVLAVEDDDDLFERDPYLKFRPPFARSLPVQLLLTGIVLALTTVLFIHLIFTGQYHWPLAPVNYALQLSGVTTLLISLIATINVVLKVAYKESSRWPYMLSYIAVNVPPIEYVQDMERYWTTAERATWMTMNAATSGLIQITHIQFLTLLYPSRLEGRLIFVTLGPMAIVAAVMQLIPIQTSNNQMNIVASAIRNVCNATLSLLFTAALFVWGLLINREQAWRTDGGTAAFGAAALMLAVIGTALNFLYIPREEEYVWLPSLMWAVILWQSFLGWWWWVGAGSASVVQSRERVEELMRKEAKKAQREKRRKEKMEQRRRARGGPAPFRWKGLTGVFGTSDSRSPNSDDNDNTRSQSQSDGEASDEARSRPIGSWGSSTDANGESSASRRRRNYASSVESSSGLTSATLPQAVPGFVHRWYARLRVAHTTAARQQAAERIARIRELERSGNAPRHSGSGWGLGSFGLRLSRDQESVPTDASTTHELRERRQAEVEDTDTEQRFRSDDQTDGEEVTSSPQNERAPASMWWWGPLRRWRLQDSTQY